MKKISLNGKWNMSGNGYNVEGNIPGSVYSFLHVDNKILPDPYFRDNEDLYFEIANHEYSFKKVFSHEKPAHPTKLVFEGLDTICSVYLNGVHLGDTANMHVEYSFDVTHLLSQTNTLKVVCHPVNPYMKEKNKTARLFGAFDCTEGYPHVRKTHCMMGWDWGPRLPDAGIWRNVYLLEENSSRLGEVHIFQRHEGGKVFLTPQVSVIGNIAPKITITSPCGEQTELSPNAENEILSPELWWPNGLGKQPLYSVRVILQENGVIVDEKQFKIGLRQIKLIQNDDQYGKSFYFEVNGADVFSMGADYIPEDNIFSRVTPERTRKLLSHCKDCNFNTIRVWGGGYYPDDYFFDICDELGLIVFCDMAFACSIYDPDQKAYDGITEEITQNLKRIRHHASLGLISGNNEIEWHFIEYVNIAGRKDLDHLKGVYLDLFERLIPSILNSVAPYIPYIPSSPTSGGNFENPNGENVGDCHDWEANYLLCRNKFYRYVSEFGFQSFPSYKTIKSFTEEKDRNPFSKIMDRHQRSNGGNELILTYLNRNYKHPTDFESFVYASQILQAETIKYRVEHYRRYRGRCMGALYWQLNDIWPCISWASIDYYGRWKALQYSAKRFFAPIHISCEEVGHLQTRSFINTEKGTFSNEKSATLFVTNDTLSQIKGRVKWAVKNAKSEPIARGIEEITVNPLSVFRLEKLYFNDINPETDHLVFSFEVDGKTESFGTVLFTQPKYYDLENPNLTFAVNGDEITIKAEAFAKGVCLEDTENDLIFDDNFFDMEKGEKKVKVISGEISSLKLRSLYDLK